MRLLHTHILTLAHLSFSTWGLRSTPIPGARRNFKGRASAQGCLPLAPKPEAQGPGKKSDQPSSPGLSWFASPDSSATAPGSLSKYASPGRPPLTGGPRSRQRHLPGTIDCPFFHPPLVVSRSTSCSKSRRKKGELQRCPALRSWKKLPPAWGGRGADFFRSPEKGPHEPSFRVRKGTSFSRSQTGPQHAKGRGPGARPSKGARGWPRGLLGSNEGKERW